MTTFRKGDRVTISGEGRTAGWPSSVSGEGTVLRKLSKTSVEVVWDGTSFHDEMHLTELLPATRNTVTAAEVGVKLHDAGNGRMVSVPEND